MNKYHSIKKTLYQSADTRKPQDLAETEYQARLSGYSTLRTNITFEGHEVFVVMFNGLVASMDKVREQEGLVNELWNALPIIAKRAYLFDLLGNEMQSTNRIENVHSTRKEIGEALKAASRNESNRRFSEFAQLYLGLTDKDHASHLPQTLEDIRDIYDRVIQGELEEGDKPDARLFRRKDVFINDESTGRQIHRGITPESAIEIQLTKLIALMHDTDIPPLVRATVCHFIFEYIHPFYDGNGRTGRYLFALQLSEHLSIPTAISLSPVVNDMKGAYYKAFDEADDPLNCSDASIFVFQMLKFISHAQRSIVDELQVKRGLLDDSWQRILNYEEEEKDSLDIDTKNVLYALIQEKLFDPSEDEVTRKALREFFNIGRDKVSTITRKLSKLGFLDMHGSRPIRYTLSVKGCQRFIQ